MPVNPCITTIILTYRRPRLLARTLGSLMAQTAQAFCVRVYDNASGDETAAVVEWFRENGLTIEYHCHPENLGCLGNFAYAFSQPLATPYCHILNDDDYILPDFYRTALDGFLAVPEAIFSAAQIAHVTHAFEVVDIPLAKWSQNVFAAGEGAVSMLNNQHPELTGMLYKSSWLKESGGFDSINYGEICDVDFYVRSAAKYPIVVAPLVGGVYSIHPAQISGQASAASALYRLLFIHLKREDFKHRRHFRQTLGAAIRRVLLSDRRGSGLPREWGAFRGLFKVAKARPATIHLAVAAYIGMYSVILRRKLDARIESEEKERGQKVMTKLSSELAPFGHLLETQYTTPCFCFVRSNSVPQTVREVNVAASNGGCV